MGFKDLIIGGIVGCSVSSVFFLSCCSFSKQEKITSAEIVTPRQTIFRNFSLENIIQDDSFIMVYVQGLGNNSYKLPVLTRDYFKLKAMNHSHLDGTHFVDWVTYEDKYIKKYAEYMTQDLSLPELKAQRLLDFIHLQIYDSRIEKEREYIRYPLETMVEGTGDCEDFSILGAALMKSIGLDVALVHYPGTEDSPGHVALGIHGNFNGSYFNVDGRKYFYAETTGTDWLHKKSKFKIGEIPGNFSGKEAKIYIVN